MKHRSVSCMWLGVFTFLVLFLGCSNQNVYLKHVKLVKQETEFTCWAATLKLVSMMYKDFPVEECEIVNSVNRYKGIPIDCCVDGSSYEMFCHRGGGISDIVLGLQKVLDVEYSLIDMPLTFEQVMKEIDANHMVIVGRTGIMHNGHIHPIIGYNKAKRKVFISEVTLGIIIEYNYDEYLGNLYHGIWTTTFIIRGKPTTKDVCSNVFGRVVCLPSVTDDDLEDELKNKTEMVIEKAKKNVLKLGIKVVEELLRWV